MATLHLSQCQIVTLSAQNTEYAVLDHLAWFPSQALNMASLTSTLQMFENKAKDHIHVIVSHNVFFVNIP